jgi:hypothetical protein
MPSALDLIREGIETANWSAVVDGYFQMTGQDVSAPPAPFRDDGLAAECMNRISEILHGYFNEPVPEHEHGNEQEELFSPEQSQAELFASTTEEPEPAKPAPAHRDEMDFTIEHKGKPEENAEGRRSTRVQPFKPGPNTFTADLPVTDSDRHFVKKVAKPPVVRRPPVKLVSVTCWKCSKKEQISPKLAPRGSGDETPLYVCNTCIPKAAH